MRIDDDKWLFTSGVLLGLMAEKDKHIAATKGLMLQPESPLNSVFWAIEEMTVASLEMLIGDNDNNLTWYAIDCDYGRNAMSAGRENDMRLIDSHDKLRWLVEIECASYSRRGCFGVKQSETEITSTDLLTGLKSWGDIAHDNNSGFAERFCPDAWILASVSWDCENMRVVYILDSGQHIADSFKIAEWIDFIQRVAEPSA